MKVLIFSWFLAMMSSSILGASVRNSASPRSVLGLKLADEKSFGNFLQRHARSFDPSDIACVSIPKLVADQNEFRSMVDHNADGKATPMEVKHFFQSFKDVTDDTVTAFIARRDLNGNGVLDFVPDYVQSLSSGENTLDNAKEWFYLQDTNDDGFVSSDEVHNVAENLGVPPENFQSYYMAFDNNNDGKLSFDEFKLIYT